ncbi:hypothetical protein BKA67DRAFT_532415 [Truncatella angustata]|uniref:Uncharacterized protein n=1 Tax=Truncatella angustata TaxID=152316 RepID=A0A9P8UQM1_9PEZI|nr:uncharacterized protein BKA67DRAFT_532415 [Truncatella angustata]KAH6657190.1 hypothetical protein BKA67DRAFT_532415 [Truncatella angustata]
MPTSTRARHTATVSQTIRGSLQCLFACVLLMIFAVAVLVGAGTIKLPPWTKSLDQYSPRDHTGPASNIVHDELLNAARAGAGVHGIVAAGRSRHDTHDSHVGNMNEVH